MITARGRGRRAVTVGAVSIVAALALAGCSGGSSNAGNGSANGAGSAKFSFLGLTSNTTPADTLKALSTTTCAAENKAQPLTTDSIAQTSLDQKTQLLAGQNALPSAQIAAGTPSVTTQYIKAGQYVDVSAALKKANLSDAILPAAASTMKALYGGSDVYAIPNEFNIEGIWYNKKILADNNIAVPTTWDDFVAATKKLQGAGVQPLTADGKDGWPVTRYVGAYILRENPNALQDIKDGKAKFTDPLYVKAANAVAALGKAGAFGRNVASNDYNGQINDFLTGKAAMMYMGSWVLSNMNDPKQNQIGADNVGFAPFPTVAGGTGTIDQYPSNVGQPIMFSQKAYGTKTAAWLSCIAKNYGDTVLDKSGVISGFKLNKSHKLSALTQDVQDKISSAKSSVLWLEALMGQKQTTTAQQNAGLLASGGISGSDFMSKLEAAK